MTTMPWAELSRKIAQLLGLHFPPERENDLRRAFARSAHDAGMPESEFAGRVLADRLKRSELETLASHLTIGETYFFRDPDLMDALRQRVLPELLERRKDARRLRLWSAGCCTGEEAYTLAMLLCDAIPPTQWQVSILATDVNPRFLHTAQAGVFGEWSFRAMPEEARHRYFRKLADGRYAIDERLKAMVTFAPLNLSEAVYPSVVTGTNAMDLILCRNVLMYFEPAQAHAVAARLGAALAKDGWLAVAPCETSRSLFGGCESVVVGNATLYRKTGGAGAVQRPAIVPEPPPASPTKHSPPVALPLRPRLVVANSADARPAHDPFVTPAHPFGLRARALANQGRLGEAKAVCDEWIASEPLDAAAHYLKALIAMELEEFDTASQSLRRCAYLAPDEPMATFAQGNLDRLRGRHRFALNAYRYVLEQLSSREDTSTLAWSDGLTTAQLRALANIFIAAEELHERAA